MGVPFVKNGCQLSAFSRRLFRVMGRILFHRKRKAPRGREAA